MTLEADMKPSLKRSLKYESKIKLLNDEINLHKRIIAQLKEENTMLRKKLKDAEHHEN